MNYYEILEINRDASEIDIKKAYKRKALRHHPDKLGGEYTETFRKICETYEVLSDPLKRRHYDTIVIPEKKPEKKTTYTRRGTDLRISITATLKDVFQAAKRTIITTRKGLCPLCSGTGSATKEAKDCPLCRGSGGGSFSVAGKKKCGLCAGSGRIPVGKKCTKCGGDGLVPERIQQEIQLSTRNVGQIIVPGAGNCCPMGGVPGNLVVDIHTEPDYHFEIKGLNVCCIMHITPSQAVLGDKVDIDVFGQKVKVRIPAGTQHWHLLETDFETGNYSWILQTRIKIVIPDFPTDKQEKLYKKLLDTEKELKPCPKITKP